MGYGSGGDVNPPYKVNLMEGLENAGVAVDQELAQTYAQWCAENEPFMGFWGHWPRYFDEMPLTDDQVKAAASRCGTALVVIGRAAGEARENDLEPGSYYLTEDEKKLLSQVSSAFQKTAVIIDAGSILDLSWLGDYPIDGALFVWQGCGGPAHREGHSLRQAQRHGGPPVRGLPQSELPGAGIQPVHRGYLCGLPLL